MITINAPDCKRICQKTYDEIILNLPLNKLSCPCQAIGNLAIHAYYNRSIINDGAHDKEKLRICRVKCGICNHTHALLLSSMVPHSQITLNAMTDVITRMEAGSGLSSLFIAHPALSESNVRYVFSMYRKHWRLKLHVHGINLTDGMVLVRGCFENFKRQFMQIRRTGNTLFFNTT